MKMYKVLVGGVVGYTNDKIFDKFMNRNLTIWQRIKLFFMR